MRGQAEAKVIPVRVRGRRYTVTVIRDSDGGRYEIVDQEGRTVASGQSRHWSFARAEREAREHAYRLG